MFRLGLAKRLEDLREAVHSVGSKFDSIVQHYDDLRSNQKASDLSHEELKKSHDDLVVRHETLVDNHGKLQCQYYDLEKQLLVWQSEMKKLRADYHKLKEPKQDE